MKYYKIYVEENNKKTIIALLNFNPTTDLMKNIANEYKNYTNNNIDKYYIKTYEV